MLKHTHIDHTERTDLYFVYHCFLLLPLFVINGILFQARLLHFLFFLYQFRQLNQVLWLTKAQKKGQVVVVIVIKVMNKPAKMATKKKINE